jgi:hypothetical protein
MNEAQQRAANKVEQAKMALDAVHGELAKAERRLIRTRADLRREIRRDPDAWNTVAAVPNE